MFYRIIISIIILVTIQSCSSVVDNPCDDCEYSYSDFLKNEDVLRSASDAYYNDDSEKTIELVENIQFAPFHIRIKYLTKAYAYAKMGKCNLVIENLELAILNGQHKNYIQLENLGNCIVDFNLFYDKLRKEYESTIDMVARKQLISAGNEDQRSRIGGYSDKTKLIDSLNQKLLFDIVQKYGWPSQDVIGVLNRSNGERHPSLIAIHTSNHMDQQLYFFDALVAASQKGNESWVHAGALFTDILIGSNGNEVETFDIQINNEVIDSDKSSFTISTICKGFKSNKSAQLTIFKNANASLSDYEKLANSFKEALINCGIETARIEISNEEKQGSRYQSNNYFILKSEFQ